MGGVVSGRASPPGAHAVCAQQSPRPPASRSPGRPRSLSRRGCGGSQHRAGRAALSQLGSLWPFRAAPEPHRGAAEWSRACFETRGSSCGSSRGGRPPLGGEGHRPSASWHAGDTRARWAGPWLSRTSGGSPSYSRFYLGAPGVSTCSRSIKFNVAAMSALVTDSAKPAGTRAGARGDLGAHPPCGGPARRQRLPGEHEE